MARQGQQGHKGHKGRRDPRGRRDQKDQRGQQGHKGLKGLKERPALKDLPGQTDKMVLQVHRAIREKLASRESEAM